MGMGLVYGLIWFDLRSLNTKYKHLKTYQNKTLKYHTKTILENENYNEDREINHFRSYEMFFLGVHLSDRLHPSLLSPLHSECTPPLFAHSFALIVDISIEPSHFNCGLFYTAITMITLL